MMDLKDSIALVTGAGGGIGRATVEALREASAEVIATDLKAPDCGNLNLAQDVTNEEGWRDLATEIERRYGRLDCLVNNAGVAVVATIAEDTLESWRKVQSVNVESIFLSLKSLLPLLRISGETRKGGASVVNLSSVGGIGGAPLMTSYCTSKGAVRLLSKAAATEFAALSYNIRVNSVHPGGIETSMMDHIITRYVELGVSPNKESARASVDKQHPLKRWGLPEEIAGGIVYLCSPAASFVTGSELVIDGGFTAH